MQPTTQLHLIHALGFIREAISKDRNRHNIICKAQEAYDLAFAVRIEKDFGYRIEGKERILAMLCNEIRRFATSNEEVEIIQFQLSSTILMLMLQFTKGSLDQLMCELQSDELIQRSA